MNKRLLILLLLASSMAGTAFAAPRNPGYVYSAFGDLVRDSYGHCIHTAYFDPNNGLTECGEGS